MNYWTGIAGNRTTRRRILQTSVAGGLSATVLALLACSTDSKSNQPSRGASGLISPPVDTSNKAKPGGVFQSIMARETEHLDTMPAPNSATAATAAAFLYSRLVRFKTGVMELPRGDIEGDLAESWEVSPDKRQVTFKLRPNAKYDQRAPTNGRNVEAKDVLFSLNRLKAVSTFKAEFFKIDTSQGPIESVSSPDSRTVVLTLARPDALVFTLLANPRYLWIQPTEADGGFDPRLEARGSGPWLLKELRQSAGIEFVRNPNWYGKGDRPFFDGVQFSFLADYAASLAQFKAKNAWTGNFVRKEDVLGLKREAPDIVVNGGQFPKSAGRLFFGVQNPQSPFRDERVRQAVSMAMDRDLVVDVFDDVQKLAKEGLAMETRWNSPIAAGWDGVWLNPKDKTFGPNGAFYNYDIAETKKLMTAAGFANGFESDFRFTSNGYDSFYRKQIEVMQNVLAEAGVRPKMIPEDYSTVFLPGLRNFGMFDGVKFNGSSAQGDPLEMISAHYHSEGSFGIHQPPFTREPDVDQQIESMRQEFDSTKRVRMMQDFQRTMSKRMRIVWHAGSTPALQLSWPWVGNYSSYTTYNDTGAGTEAFVHYWYDASQRKV